MKALLMRPWILSLFAVLTGQTAFAQAYYAEQTYQQIPQSYPQQVSGNYYQAPAYAAPAQPQVQAVPAPAHSSNVAPQAQPWDYGQSVKTDIRQMNF